MVPELKDALHLDLETGSVVNLRKTGPFVYGEHWSTRINCACFARGDGPVDSWIPPDHKGGYKAIPAAVARAAEDGVPFVAHNVGFERALILTQLGPKYGWPVLPIDRWYCTAAMGAAMAMPRDLENMARLLGCTNQKDMAGNALMRKFMKPTKQIKCLMCGGRGHPGADTRQACFACEGHGVILEWYEDANDLQRLVAYCAQDVETERDIAKKVFPLSASERQVWLLDQTMNERGVLIDRPTVGRALKIVKGEITKLNNDMKVLTGGALNPFTNQVEGGILATQVRKLRWWMAFEGVDVADLRKETIVGLLASENLDANVKQALTLRQEAAKSSTAKLNAYEARTCADSYMRDNLMYHGASTGRWSGRGAQLQNLPARYLMTKAQIELALQWLSQYPDITAEELRWFDAPLEVISAALRGMVIAAPGHQLYAGDFNAIEARGTAWLARATGMLGVFSRGEDPYLFMASLIYSHVDISGVDWKDEKQVEAIKKKYGRERQLGKIAVLGLGYQMGWEKFQATCAKERIFITDEEAKDVVFAYRHGNPEIPDLWKELNDGAFNAVQNPGKVITCAFGMIQFLRRGNWLYMRLPSGRLLYYAHPGIKKRALPWIDEETGYQAQGWGVTFWGMSSVTHHWCEQHAYGGKWTENAVQALCRDLLAGAMLRLEARGYTQIMSIHDEAVSMVPLGFGSVPEYNEILCAGEAWAPGFPLASESWCGPRLRK